MLYGDPPTHKKHDLFTVRPPEPREMLQNFRLHGCQKKKKATIPAHHLRNEPHHDANHGWAGLCSCEQVYRTFWPLNFLRQRFFVELPKQAQPPSPHPRRTTAAATQLPPHLVCSGGMDWLLRRRATRSHYPQVLQGRRGAGKSGTRRLHAGGRLPAPGGLLPAGRFGLGALSQARSFP